MSATKPSCRLECTNPTHVIFEPTQDSFWFFLITTSCSQGLTYYKRKLRCVRCFDNDGGKQADLDSKIETFIQKFQGTPELNLVGDLLKHDIPLVSSSVHQMALAHFSTYPLDTLVVETTIRDPRSLFFNAYTTLLLGKSGPQRMGDFAYPPPFYQILEEYVVLYIQHVYPYFQRLGWPDDAEWPRNGPSLRDPRSALHETFSFLGALHIEEVVVAPRWKHGMLRERQIKLIELVLRNFLEQLRAILEVSIGNENLRLVEFGRVCLLAGLSISSFFGSPRLRSERLEVLLLRYLDEKDVNWEVVRGLDKAQRDFEGRSGEWERELGGWRLVALPINGSDSSDAGTRKNME
ncbi:hypothetical protein BJ508DRAFT_367734 [Ascobolus immersus RN42]|uniref:Uncharacterized protein n=1 Tax=Ascobolus immersus RN42 TaxID=1160509 RepID=A0A3N4HGJ0_ASCIM|nr:hypothetical protein BJ508DRAFT_367734 [Ascobolus immersus RN42]